MENNNDKTFFYVGQEVSHQSHGNGEIIDIDNGRDFPVHVFFKSGVHIYFTLQGKVWPKDKFPSLSQEPHKPLELKEILTFKKFELVWCKFNNLQKDWSAAYYSHLENVHHCFNEQKKDEGGFYSPVMQIRKFRDIPF